MYNLLISWLFAVKKKEYKSLITNSELMQYPFIGIHVTIDLTKSAGSRIKDLEVRCSDSSEDKYEKIIPNKDYAIVVPSYLVNAGDGYKVLKENHRKRVEGKLLDSFSHNLSIS